MTQESKGANATMVEHTPGPLRYGLRVFPCKPKSKVPDGSLVPRGSTDATNDPAQIRSWWAESPDANIGVTSDDGLIIDIDEGVTCLEDVRKFAQTHDMQWPTLVIRTGRRPGFGVQLHYVGETKGRSYKVGDISGEVRGHHLYGLWHGSVHPVSGAAYEIIVDAPRAQFTGGERLVRKPGSDENTHENEPRTKQQIRATVDALLANAGKAEQGTRNEFAHKAAWFTARAFLSGVLESTEAELKARLFEAVDPLYAPGERDVRHMIDDSWSRGSKAGPLPVLDPAHELAAIDAWLNDTNLPPPPLEDLLTRMALCEPMEIERRRKRIATRLNVSIPWLKGAIKSHQESARSKQVEDAPPFDTTAATIDEVRKRVELLLDENPDEIHKKLAETIIWEYLWTHAKIFNCYGIGYVLLNESAAGIKR